MCCYDGNWLGASIEPVDIGHSLSSCASVGGFGRNTQAECSSEDLDSGRHSNTGKGEI